MPVLPQFLVFQELTTAATEIINPLRAFVFGPEYDLHRYLTSEKASVGTYSPLTGLVSTWARRPGAAVDLDFTRVYLESADLVYWTNSAGPFTTGSSYTSPDGITITSVSGYPNRLTVEGVNLVDQTGFALDASLYSRDVVVGDYAIVSGTVDGETYTLTARITGLIADPTLSVVSAAQKATANAAAQIAASPTEITLVGSVDVVADSTSYDGLPSGDINETYTITARRGTTGSNPGTAILDIVSASGRDDVLGYMPLTDDFADDIALGTRGAVFVFDMASPANLVAGASWRVIIQQVFTSPAPTSAGTYSGTTDTTYVVRVLRGGDRTAVAATDRPSIQVTTTTGVDSTPAKTIGSGAVSVGNRGVTINWTGDILRAGDVYYIPASAVGTGAVRTISLDRNLPDELLSPIDLSLSLAMRRNVELPANLPTQGIANWTAAADALTLNTDAMVLSSEWRDGESPLPVAGGNVYPHWRELIVDHADRVYSVDSTGGLASEFDTPVDSENPLVYAISKALLNANGGSVRAMAVASNDLTGYQTVLTAVETRYDIYSMVPLTRDTAITDAVTAHVLAMSAPENRAWRRAIVTLAEINPAPVLVSITDEGEVTPPLATVSGAEVTLTNAADDDFLTAGVLAGDAVRINYTVDERGREVYDQYVVDEVISNTRIRLTTTPALGVPVASLTEVYRTLDTGGVATAVSAQTGRYRHRRITAIFPDRVESGGVEVDGVFMAAAFAGLASGVPPHQGLTNVEIRGFDNVDRVAGRFNRSQLRELSDAGVCVITHDSATLAVFPMHALTTDVSSLNSQEEMITRNLDSISYYFQSSLSRYIGRANVTPTFLELLKTHINGGFLYLRSASFTELLGGQIIDGSIRTLRPHATLADRVVIVLEPQLPKPFNNGELTLVI